MNVITSHRLAEGPIVFTPRGEKIAAMAQVLIGEACAGDYGDSILVLVADGRWTRSEIIFLVEDARAVATQYAVAMEMGASS